MNQLRLAGIHDDGEHLVLESANGDQFILAIDQNLRTSIAKARRIQPARGLNAHGSFGPRDIQTRFRQGATVEEVVAESGWDAERVRRYEWPIVAERANIISMSRRVLISQHASGRRSSTSALSLDEYIERVAQHYGFDPADADWNTYQQESGQWSVTVDFSFNDEVSASLPRGVVFPARWSYNPANQSIYASNEAAYFLMGRDHSSDAPLPGIGVHASDQVDDEEAVEESAPENSSSLKVVSQSKTAEDDLLEELDQRRGIRDFSSARERKLADLLERARRTPSSPLVNTEDDANAAESALDDTETEQGVEQASSDEQSVESEESHEVSDSVSSEWDPVVSAGEEIEEESVPEETPAPTASADDQEETKDASAASDAPSSSEPEKTEESKHESAQDEKAEQKSPKTTGKPKRTSVPSWDDIIFGNQRR